MSKKWVPAFGLLAAVLPSLSASASTIVEQNGPYITYRSNWQHLSRSDQKLVIDKSVALLEAELQVTSKITGLKTLSNSILKSDALDTLTNLAQESVTILDKHNARELIPAGILIRVGGSFGIGLALNGKLSGDLGVVVVPTEVTNVNTMDGTSETHFELDYNVVVVPHGELGFGPKVTAGPSGTGSISFIFGDLNRAKDFHGVIGSGAGDLKMFYGIDLEGSVVHNSDISKSYFLVTTSQDIGAEAGASLDFEVGDIKSLSDVLDTFGKTVNGLTGTVTVDPTKSNPKKTDSNDSAKSDDDASDKNDK